MEGFVMSLISPPGQGRQLAQLLAFIVDDDDRTRRANLLLRTVSTCLLIAGAIVAMVMPLAVGFGQYSVAAGGVVVLLLRRARTHRQRSGR
jgi:hypothetical protein